MSENKSTSHLYTWLKPSHATTQNESWICDYMQIGLVLALVGSSDAYLYNNNPHPHQAEREQVHFTSVYMTQAFTCDYTKWVMNMWLHANWTCSRSRRLEWCIPLQYRLSLTSIRAIAQGQIDICVYTWLKPAWHDSILCRHDSILI